MNIRKIITATTISIMSLASIANAATEEEKGFIKLFGQILATQAGVVDLSLDKDELSALFAGMEASVNGEKLPENIQEIGPKMQAFLEGRANALNAKKAEKTAGEVAEFWKSLEGKEGLQKTESGLAYEIISAGDTRLPKEDSFVVINYKGTLIDGTVFDESDKENPAKFSLNEVIPGFKEGLQKVGKGGKIKLYIPANLAYGDANIPGIPAGSTLIFDVDMVDVADAPAAPANMPQMPQ